MSSTSVSKEMKPARKLVYDKYGGNTQLLISNTYSMSMNKGRVIFVGIHNKPGMEPLDSRTKSGKIIDEVIKGLEGFECVKTNLFDVDEMPTGADIGRLACNWVDRINPQGDDVFILLGQLVIRHWPLPGHGYYFQHPASRHIKRDQYIKDLISKILNHDH